MRPASPRLQGALRSVSCAASQVGPLLTGLKVWQETVLDVPDISRGGSSPGGVGRDKEGKEWWGGVERSRKVRPRALKGILQPELFQGVDGLANFTQDQLQDLEEEGPMGGRVLAPA